jgi:hypothetical protein
VARRLSIHARRRQRGSDHLEERRKKGARGVSHPHARPRLRALEERGEGGAAIGGARRRRALRALEERGEGGLHAPTHAHQMQKTTGSTGGLADTVAVDGRNGADARRKAI